MPAGDDPAGLLPAREKGPAGAVAPTAGGQEDAHDFGRNGSYLVLRTLSRTSGAFWRTPIG